MTLPLRGRLTAIYGVAFCLGGVALEAGVYLALRLAVYAISDRDLNSRLAGVEEFLDDHIPRLDLARVRREIRTHAALQPGLLSVVGERGAPLHVATALWAYRSEGSEDPGPRVWNAGDRARPLRLLAARHAINGENYQLLLGSDLTAPFEVVHRFGLLLLITSPMLIAVSAAIGHWTAGRALSPMVAITNAARAIDANALNRRIDLPEGKDELRYLAETLNDMLSRIDLAFRKTVEFTANASHELRTPLAVIRATAEVALMRGAPEGTKADGAALRQILREAERTTTLLEDLLRLARADSGTAVLHLRPVDLAESAVLACRRCEPLAAKRRLKLRCVSLAGPVWVSADPGYLRSLLLILLDNALKYTPGGGTIVATLATRQGQAVCEVRDTGIGISESDLPHIFERFYRSDRARNREEGGAGLGLSIAQWMAQVHGGSIEVESEPSVGSTFRIVLPRLLQPCQETADSRRALSESKS